MAIEKCSGDRYPRRMSTLTSEEVQKNLSKLAGWALEGEAIARTFTFRGFPEAIGFVVQLGFAAEAADHHPDITLSYKRVTLRYTTHSDGGLTAKDFAGATGATGLAESLGGK